MTTTKEKMKAFNLINGVWEPAFSGRSTTTLDPATGLETASVADGERGEAEAAVEAAAASFARASWSQNPRLRQMVLLRWADRLEKEVDSLATLLTRTNGKIIGQSYGEIGAAISEIRYYAGMARHVVGHNAEVAPGEFSTMLREPAGVAALIIPWNAPAVLLIRSLAPALAAGCTTVIKLATQTALFTARLLEHLNACEGLPAGVVNAIHETGHQGSQYLVESSTVDVVSFTGSTAVGKTIMAAAAGTVKKLSLELGGKSCAIIMPDADVPAAAKSLARAATIISGQQCTAVRRVLVHESHYNEMADELTKALANLKVGNGLDAGTSIGPLIDRASRDRIRNAIDQAFEIADRVLLRGRIPEDMPPNSAFLTPSLVAHEDSNAFFVQEEIFGPFVVLERFNTETEAAEKANNTVFGLSASVWTDQNATAWRMARTLRRGTVWINDHNKLFAEAETGGYRQSGLGRLHGYEALSDFTETKHIYQNVGTLAG